MLSAQHLTIEDFFRNPERSQYRISPDGQWLAWLEPYQNRQNVFVQRVGEQRTYRITEVLDRDIQSILWKGDNTILFSKDNGGDENFQLFKVDLLTERVENLTPFDSTVSSILDDLEDHPTDILYTNNRRNPEIFDVYRLNVKTGVTTLVLQNPGNHTGWLTDHEGKIRIATATDGVTTTLFYRATEQDSFSKVLTTNFKQTVYPALFTFDNKRIYAVSNLNRDRTALVEMNPETGEELSVLYEHPVVDISDIDYSRLRKVLTSVEYEYEKPEMHFLDSETEKMYSGLRERIKGYEIAFVSNDRAENLFIIRTYNDRTRGSYHLFDKKTGALTKLTDLSPWLPEEQMARVRPISFTSRDGLKIHGYLTLPLNADTTNLPVVLNVHGGPWARDSWGFDPECQFLASRGYAVLQVNYRGSTGYGRKFWESSFKQWGRKMQDDLTEGVQWLIKQKIANPRRIAIYGGSYGGYATLAGLAFTPDLYACGIDYVGVSNLFTFMNTIPPYWKPYLEMMYEMVGHPEKDKELMRAASPVYHVNRIKVPLFVAQGRNDPRVNIAESDQIVEALKKRSVDVPYMVKDNEGHGFGNEENRFDFYRAMEAFLTKHLVEKPVQPAKSSIKK